MNPKHLKKGTVQENNAYKYSEKYYGNGKPLRRYWKLPFAA